MKTQLPLLLLLSASTFGLGHELGANGPRDNPLTPWGPGDTPMFDLGVTRRAAWLSKNSDKTEMDWLDLIEEDPSLADSLLIEEEVGDWVRMPNFGMARAFRLLGHEVWWSLSDIREARGRWNGLDLKDKNAAVRYVHFKPK